MARKSTDIAEHRGHNDGLVVNNGGVDNSVDRIRDIIFGEQIQDYSAKFDEIATQLSAIDARLAQINDRISEHERDVDSQIQHQKQKFESDLAQLDSEFTKQLADLAEETQQRADSIKSSVSTLGKKVRKEMRESAQELSTLKMDRGTLGDLFVQMGEVLVANEPARTEEAAAQQLPTETATTQKKKSAAKKVTKAASGKSSN